MAPTIHMETWLAPSSFWAPRHMSESAWLEHAPFAYWLMDAISPRRVVELGTHTGFSYFVWCDAVKRLGLKTETFAVDSWEGDAHAGFYGEDIYESVQAINQSEYSGFSTLLRGYFDDKLGDIEDGSVDLLHIDGRHGYDDVRHDFEMWVPKLSDSGVVLFHDTTERERGFGVWQYWSEISRSFPSFEFEHGHGLGVLAFGADVPSRLQSFLIAAGIDPLGVRNGYADLGRKINTQYALNAAHHDLQALRNELAAARWDIEVARDQLKQREASERSLAAQLAEYKNSTSWKLTRPVRVLGAAVAHVRRGHPD